MGLVDKFFGTGTLTFKGMATETSDRIIEIGSLYGIRDPISNRKRIVSELKYMNALKLKNEES